MEALRKMVLGVPCEYFCRECLSRNDPLKKHHDDGPPGAEPLPATCLPFPHDPTKVALFRRGLTGFTDRVPAFTSEDILQVTEDDIPRWVEKVTVPTVGPRIEVTSCVMTALPADWIPQVPDIKIHYARFEPREGDMLNRTWFDEKGVRHEIALPPYCIADPKGDTEAWVLRNKNDWPGWASKGMPTDTVNKLLRRENLTPLARDALNKLGAFLLAKTCKIGCGYIADGSVLGISKDHDFAILKGRYPMPRMPVAQSDALTTMYMALQQREIWSLYRDLLSSSDPNDDAPAYVFKELLLYHGAVEIHSCIRRGYRTSNFPFKEPDIVREMYEGTKSVAAAYRHSGKPISLAETDPLVAELDQSLGHLGEGQWDVLSLGDLFQRVHA